VRLGGTDRATIVAHEAAAAMRAKWQQVEVLNWQDDPPAALASVQQDAKSHARLVFGSAVQPGLEIESRQDVELLKAHRASYLLAPVTDPSGQLVARARLGSLA
jgi:hypothetical protein